MIFHEIYSSYYAAVEQMISLALENKLNKSSAWDICNQAAFKESFELIWTAITAESWRVLPLKGKLPYRHTPNRPLTFLERRWLKAILSDTRIKLFNIKVDGLDNIEPLFTPQDWYIANTYSDGDPYNSPEYITHFQIILKAFRNHTWLSIDMTNQAEKATHVYIQPQNIEYSMRDDKFRVLCTPQSEVDIINIGRIKQCTVCTDKPIIKQRYKRAESLSELVLAVSDTRNGLERVMTRFSAYDKSLEKQSENYYRLTVHYHPDEQSDLLLQVMSFGPVVRVMEPVTFANKIKERLADQLNILNK